MKEIVADEKLIARCGLYCGACRQYLRGKCPGCAANEKATWCGVRKCTSEHKWSSCAECSSVGDVQDCAKFNNFMAKLFGLIFRSNRRECILKIRAIGREKFAGEMAIAKRPSL